MVLTRRSALRVLVLLLAASPVRADWLTVTEAEGLLGGGVRDVAVTPSGEVWVTTGRGVSHFDRFAWADATPAGLPDPGPTLLRLTRDGTPIVAFPDTVLTFAGGAWQALPGSPRTTFIDGALAGGGEFWFLAEQGGVFSYADSVWTQQPVVPGVGLSLLLDPGGTVWVSGTLGLFRKAGAGWESVPLPAGWPQAEHLASAPDGSLWIASGSGVARYDGAWQLFDGDPAAPVSPVSLHVDARGTVWAGGTNLVRRFRDGAWERVDDPAWFGHFPAAEIRRIAGSATGEVMFAGDTGSWITRYDGWGFETFGAVDGLGTPASTVLHFGPDGSLWSGSDAAGSVLSRFDGESWQRLGPDEDLVGTVFDLARDGADVLWIGTGFGLGRFDGRALSRSSAWTTGLTSTSIQALLAGPDFPAWIATTNEVARWNGTSWVTELPHRGYDLLEAPDGAIWAATSAGAWRWDGAAWTSFGGDPATLPALLVQGLAVDRNGNLWFATDSGVTRRDAKGWTTWTSRDGLPGDDVNAVFVAADGLVWVGTDEGLASFSSGLWTVYRDLPGLSSNAGLGFTQSVLGVLWVGTTAGVSRYDGRWISYGSGDGVAPGQVRTLLPLPSGRFAFGGAGGLTLHGEDRVAPVTVIRPELPVVSTSRRQTIAYVPGFNETGIGFQWRLDGVTWSPWQTENFSIHEKLEDTQHVFEVRGRDRLGNVEEVPAQVTFEIDSTPPSPAIISPVFGEAVAGVVDVVGRVSDPRLQGWLLALHGADRDTILTSSSQPVVNGVLHSWDTTGFPDGDYELFLQASDTLGLIAGLTQSVIVDNEAPFAAETTPVRIRAAQGGEVWTTNREAHLFVPPGALSEDAVVSIRRWITPPTGVVGVELKSAWRIGLDRGELRKPIVLDVTLAGSTTSLDSLRFSRHDGGQWFTLGGSPVEGGSRFAVATADTGGIGLFVGEPGVGTPAPPLSSLRLSPRAFSPSGPRAAISFTLGSAGSVSVRVYNRAGRVVRVLERDGFFSAGINLVPWDGRDEDGSTVPDGLYLVAVEAHGERLVESLAVVR